MEQEKHSKILDFLFGTEYLLIMVPGCVLAVAMAGVGPGTDIRKLARLRFGPFVAGLFAALCVGVVSLVLIMIFI